MEAGPLQPAARFSILRLRTNDLTSPTNELLQLPDEVLFRIAEYLDSTSLLSMRDTSKRLQSVLHKRFTDTFIAETVVSSSRPGLKRLVSLITCADFAYDIRKIVIKHNGRQEVRQYHDDLLKKLFEDLRKSKNQFYFSLHQVGTYGVRPMRSCQRIAEFVQNMLHIAVSVGLVVRGISIDLEDACWSEKPRFDGHSDVLEAQSLKDTLFTTGNKHCAFRICFTPRSGLYQLDSHLTLYNEKSNLVTLLQASQVNIRGSLTLPNKTLTAIQLSNCDIDASPFEKPIWDNEGSLRHLCLAQVRMFFHMWDETPPDRKLFWARLAGYSEEGATFAGA